MWQNSIRQWHSGSVDRNLSFGGIGHSRDHLQRRGLSGAVGAQESHCLAAPHFEGEIVASVHRGNELALVVAAEHAEEALLVVLVQLVRLRDVIELDGDGSLTRGHRPPPREYVCR